MKIIKWLLPALLTLGLIGLLSWSRPSGELIPAAGKFFYPASGFWQNAVTAKDDLPNDFAMLGLRDSVEVVVDDRLVPHIFAHNLEDAIQVQGYLVAKYRLFQMDMAVRASGGRLSEILGDRTLEVDRRQRRRGMQLAADNAVKAWKNRPREFSVIQAYARGVNAYINTLNPADYPLEYKLLEFSPEKWTPKHTALFMKRMAEDLASYYQDIGDSNAAQVLGDSLYQALYPAWYPQQSPIIPTGTPFQRSALVDSSLSERENMPLFPYKPDDLPPEGIGSNNWAVSGQRTASGFPILCNDPHLSLTLPAIWFEIQLHCPGLNGYGVSLPGLPGFPIGFNENIAWGLTNLGHDVTDWYRIDWTDDTKEAYYLDGEIKPVTYRYDTIRLRGGNELIDTTVYTVWGPVVYTDSSSSAYDLAMHWAVHEELPNAPRGEIGTFLTLMEADDYTDYYKALTYYGTPAQNFVFASNEGDIAMTVTGRLPIKRVGQGRFVQEGNTIKNAWQGNVPYKDLPRIKNPERGFVSSANQHSTAPDYPYYYNGRFDHFRGRYINSRLAAMDSSITTEDMKALQMDTYSMVTQDICKPLLSLTQEVKLSAGARKFRQELIDWDGRFDKDKFAPIIYQRWSNAMYKNTFDEIYSLAKVEDMAYPGMWRLGELMTTAPNHKIFDIDSTTQVETASVLAATTLEALVPELEEAKKSKLNWWQENAVRISHLTQIDAFSSETLQIGGHSNAPNAIRSGHGPSWRMVVALGEEPKAEGVFPGGQSGHPGSQYYDNMIADWSNGRYHKLHLMKDKDDNTVQVLKRVTFQPKSK